MATLSAVLTVELNLKPKIAFLAYAPLKQRRSNNSFEGNGNVGALVVESVLKSNGLDVARCTPESAHKQDVVLVSFTSNYDVVSFYQAVALRPEWARGKRKFIVIGGGFGMQNPTLIRDYLDYAAFGRVENWIYQVIDTILGGGIPKHPSLMNLPDLHGVMISQSPDLYDGPISGTAYGSEYKETFTGCPYKCMFCHYTWAREYQDIREENRGSYVQESLTSGNTPELTWDQLFTYDKKAGRIRVAIDGFSQRLRYIYGKRILNDDIAEGINAIGQYEGNTVLLVYNICNMPTETEQDINELYTTLRRADPFGRVIFVLHSTPFRPSLATPMQWEPVNLWPEWIDKRAEVIDDRANFRATHSFTLEGAWSHLLSVIVERATPESSKMFHDIAFSSTLTGGKYRSAQKIKILENHYDLSQYLKEYDVDEKLPGWFLSSYTDIEKMKRAARILRERARDANYQAKGKSLVQIRLAKA